MPTSPFPDPSRAGRHRGSRPDAASQGGRGGRHRVEAQRARPRALAVGALAAGLMMTPMFTSPALADYTVRPGDTLSKIAERHNVTWQSLYRLNRDVVADPDQIYVGQSLNLNGRNGRNGGNRGGNGGDGGNGGRDSGPAVARSFSAPSDGSFRQRALAGARRLQGISYVYGGDSPAEGFDCSGFTSYVFGRAGKQIPRTSSAQAAAATPISRSQLRPGDLIFFRPYGSVSHVAIYAGNSMVWESPGTGQQVRYAGIWDVPRSYGRF